MSMAHFFDLSPEGELVSAAEAVSGVDYYCPHCLAVMHLRKCIVRAPHFFVLDDGHKSKDCGQIERERNVIRVPSLLKRNAFRNAVLYPRKRGKGAGKHGNGEGKTPSAGREMRPPNGLRQLIVSGVRAMDPCSPIDEGVLSDVYIGPKAYAKCLQEGVDLNFRIIDLWLNSAIDGRIRYVANWSYRGQLKRAFFEHHVDDELNFEEIADSLFRERRYYYGRTLWVKPRYKSVAVGGDWSFMDRERCQQLCGMCENGRRPCLGLWFSRLTHMGQIYYSDLPDNRYDK